MKTILYFFVALLTFMLKTSNGAQFKGLFKYLSFIPNPFIYPLLDIESYDFKLPSIDFNPMES